MAQRIVLIEHHVEPREDRAQAHLASLGYELDWRRPFAGDPLDEPDPDVAGTVIYGGGQDVPDRHLHPFLDDELRWIERCLERELPIVGLCLGGQLLAHALGAEVRPHPDGLYEFGYYPLRTTEAGSEILPGDCFATQAHGYGFDLPHGARLLATGEDFPNQAFRYGERAYGFQCHPECTLDIFRRWQASDWVPWDRPGVQARADQDRLSVEHDPIQHEWFTALLDRLFGAGGKAVS